MTAKACAKVEEFRQTAKQQMADKADQETIFPWRRLKDLRGRVCPDALACIAEANAKVYCAETFPCSWLPASD